MPSNPACAMLISLVDEYWASSWPTAAPQAMPQNIQGVCDAIVALQHQQVCIIEHLDELSSVVRGQNMGKDMDHPLIASPTTADHMAPLSDTMWALLNMPQETLIHLGPAVRQEQDPILSKFMSHSQDLPPGALLYATPPTSALMQHIQIPHCLDTKLDSVVDFYLPSPVPSSQPLRLLDGRW